MKRTLLVLCLLATSACASYEHKSTLEPTTTGLAALLGNWSSANVVPSASACSDFKWNVTQQTGNTASGTFSATCAGDVKINGTANGTLNASTVTWNAQATGTMAGVSCPITLNGTAELGVDSVRVPYSGTACGIPVSGVEVLKKN